MSEIYLIKNKFLLPFILFVTCFLLYGNTLHNEYAVDDGIYTNQNKFIIQGFPAVKEIFNKGSLYGYRGLKNNGSQYRPVSLLSFMAEVSIFGFRPHVSHFVNVLLYACTCVLLWFFLKIVLKDYPTEIPIAAALLFLFHPIHTEVVANVKSRDEILGFLFGLGAFYFVLLYVEGRRSRFYVFSLICFFISLFCKENCLTFAAIIPLLFWFFTPLDFKKTLLYSAPYILLVAVYLFIRAHVLQDLTFSHKITVTENTLISAGNPWEDWATRFLLMGKYIYMTIVPYPLCWDYSYNQIPIVSWGTPGAWFSLLVFTSLIAVVVTGIRKKSIASFLIAFFIITLILSSNLIIKILSTFGERFLYTPSLSFCIALPLVISGVFKKYFYVPVFLVLLLYTAIVIPRNFQWKDNLTLYTADLSKIPNSARAHLVLAEEYTEQMKKALTKNEKERLFSRDLSETNRAISIYDDYYSAWLNLGNLYLESDSNEKAIHAFQKALSIYPGSTAAANNLGVIYMKKADYKKALACFRNVLNSDSSFKDIFSNIGMAYKKMENLDKAAWYYKMELKRNPGNTSLKYDLFVMFYNSGVDQFNSRDFDKAEGLFMQAVNYNERSAEVYGYLGVLRQMKHDKSKAVEYYKKSLEIKPEDEIIKKNLTAIDEKANQQ